jgi:hypothetical protein
MLDIDRNNAVADKEESFCGWARKSSGEAGISPADVLSYFTNSSSRHFRTRKNGSAGAELLRHTFIRMRFLN